MKDTCTWQIVPTINGRMYMAGCSTLLMVTIYGEYCPMCGKPREWRKNNGRESSNN